MDDTVVNLSDLPKLVSRVPQCSTEWSTELLRMEGIYTLERARGRWGNTAGLPSAFCFGLHSLVVFATEGSHTDRGIHANTKSVQHTSYLCRSVVDLYRGKTGWCSIVKYIYRTLLGRWFDLFRK